MNGYKIQNLGDHMVLFVFNNSSDVERRIENQPWSFDKHLVVLQTVEEFSKLKDLVFDIALFWVQVQDIPVRFMSKKVAESICETIREVRRSPESTMMMEVTSFEYVSQWILLFLYAKVGCSSQRIGRNHGSIFSVRGVVI